MNCHAVYRVRTNCPAVCLGVFCLWQKPGNTDKLPCSLPRGCKHIVFALSRQVLRTCAGNAGWSSPVARQAHNLKAAGSNPAPATKSPKHSPKNKISKLKETADHWRRLRARENNPSQDTTTKARQQLPNAEVKAWKTVRHSAGSMEPPNRTITNGRHAA